MTCKKQAKLILVGWEVNATQGLRDTFRIARIWNAYSCLGVCVVLFALLNYLSVYLFIHACIYLFILPFWKRQKERWGVFWVAPMPVFQQDFSTQPPDSAGAGVVSPACKPPKRMLSKLHLLDGWEVSGVAWLWSCLHRYLVGVTCLLPYLQTLGIPAFCRQLLEGNWIGTNTIHCKELKIYAH